MVQQIKKTPVFIPRLQHSNALEGVKLEVAIMGAHHIEGQPKTRAKIKAVTSTFIIDPVTHRFLYQASGDAKSFRKLPYPHPVSAEQLYDPDFRYKKVVGPSIEHQIQRGADVIVAPYLFSVDSDDTKFTTNLSMLSETIRYVEEKKFNKPVYAMIHIGRTVLTHPLITNFISARYRDEELKDKITGYIVTIDDMDDRLASVEELNGLARLVFQLSETHKVLANSIGGFGEVLCALGASGFTSGLATGEVTAVKTLNEKLKKGWKNRRLEMTYVPEIMGYANDAQLKKIGYKCNCVSCGGGVPLGALAKKRHFLFTHLDAIKALAVSTNYQKFVTTRLKKAIIVADGYKNKFQLPFKTIHLHNWLTVLQTAESWTQEEDSKELNALLIDLQSNRE